MAAKAAKAPARKATPKPPEVRQNTDPESPYFGCVALQGRGRMEGLWFIGHPETGGSWDNTGQADTWTALNT